jgi:hypothetical protein
VSLPPRLVPLAGREELLAELDARLSGDESPEPRIVVLYGLGGAGKSSMAVEYAYRHLAEVRLAWQFAAADLAVLADEFGELAAQLGVRDLLVTRNWVATVHGVLARYPARWLLLFDNAADAASVAEFLPPAGLGRVLVTSQNPAWQTGQTMEVPVLRPEVAADFLVQRTGDPDRQAAEDLAKELDGLPLALAQAAAYMQATGDRLAEYLESFRQRRADMLARGASIRHGKTVASTWALAFGRLQQDTPTAVGLLRLMTHCAPEAIPLRLLLQPRPGLAGQLGQEVAPLLAPLLADQLIAKDAIAALRRYSLITHVGEGPWSVHRLVQAVALDQIPADVADQWRQATAALVEAAIPGDPQLPATWPTYAALVPHARAVLDPTSGGLWQIARYLGFSGSSPAARDLTRQIADAYTEDGAAGEIGVWPRCRLVKRRAARSVHAVRWATARFRTRRPPVTWTPSAASSAGTPTVLMSTLWWISSSRRQEPSPTRTKVVIWRTNRPGAGSEKRVMIAQLSSTRAAGGASCRACP